MIQWRSHLLLPTVTEPTTIVVAAPGYTGRGEEFDPFVIGMYQAFPDGRVEGEITGMPPSEPNWFWCFETDICVGLPTYPVR